MKSNFLVGLAAVGYFLFFFLALLGMSGAGLNVFYPTGICFWMAGCSLGAMVFGSNEQRRVAVLGLVVALVMGVYCWHHNRPFKASLLEMQQKEETNYIEAAPTTNTTR